MPQNQAFASIEHEQIRTVHKFIFLFVLSKDADDAC